MKVTPDQVLAAIAVGGVLLHTGMLMANLRELRRIATDHEDRIRKLEIPPLQPASRI